MRTSFGENFSQIRTFLWELLPKKSQNWAQLGHQAKKTRCIFQVKSRTTNTQKLKIVDPQTMEKWGSYRLCEIFCGPFGRTPGGNLGPFFAQKMFFSKIFIRIRRFIWGLGLVSSDSPKKVVFGKIFVCGNIFRYQEVNWAQNRPKRKTLGTSRLCLNSLFWIIIHTLTLPHDGLPLVQISINLSHI